MNKRSKKLLSLFLAAAMVFTMNTAIYGEEKAVVSFCEFRPMSSMSRTGSVLPSATSAV